MILASKPKLTVLSNGVLSCDSLSPPHIIVMIAVCTAEIWFHREDFSAKMQDPCSLTWSAAAAAKRARYDLIYCSSRRIKYPAGSEK